MGECAGSPHFTHVSFDDFRMVHDNLTGGNRTTQGRLVPFCLFTDPELARVGLSESEARKLAIPYRLARIPMAAVLRTRTLSETRGFMKALISADTDDPRIYIVRNRGWRVDDDCADRHPREATIHRASRRYLNAPDYG
jgi:pyruvate/2-oxoglutarate dehydrogenase complex dihydrolipoamide dehydrogenase (E3) component